MNNPPINLISVILPTHNGSEFLNESIRSVVEQSYRDLELIIVDDGSTDNTKPIVDEWIKLDSRIKYFNHERNEGLSAARNTGIRNSSGNIIALIDSDDIWLTDKLKKQIVKLENSDLIYTSAILIDQRGKNLNKTFWNSVKVTPAQGRSCLTKLFRKNFIIPASSFMFKKTILGRVGLFDEGLKSIEDLDFTLRILSSGYSIDFVEEPQVLYRINPNQMSKKLFKMEFWRVYVLFKFVFRHPKFFLAHPVLSITQLVKRILVLFYRLIFN